MLPVWRFSLGLLYKTDELRVDRIEWTDLSAIVSNQKQVSNVEWPFVKQSIFSMKQGQVQVMFENEQQTMSLKSLSVALLTVWRKFFVYLPHFYE